MRQRGSRSQDERITNLEDQISEMGGKLSELTRGLQGLVRSPGIGSQPAFEPSIISGALKNASPISNSFCLRLPLFDQNQIRDARILFRTAGRLGLGKIPANLASQMVVWHIIFAASTECEAWTAEWDRIIDEARGLVDQGAQRVVDFINEQMTEAGFPEWAKAAVGAAVEAILGLGQGELETGLELARYAGRLGLLIRCHWPF
jgi:hypothetical protein